MPISKSWFSQAQPVASRTLEVTLSRQRSTWRHQVGPPTHQQKSRFSWENHRKTIGKCWFHQEQWDFHEIFHGFSLAKLVFFTRFTVGYGRSRSWWCFFNTKQPKGWAHHLAIRARKTMGSHWSYREKRPYFHGKISFFHGDWTSQNKDKQI